MAAGFQWQMAPARSSPLVWPKDLRSLTGQARAEKYPEKIKDPLKNSVNLDLFRTTDRSVSGEMEFLG